MDCRLSSSARPREMLVLWKCSWFLAMSYCGPPRVPPRQPGTGGDAVRVRPEWPSPVCGGTKTAAGGAGELGSQPDRGAGEGGEGGGGGASPAPLPPPPPPPGSKVVHQGRCALLRPETHVGRGGARRSAGSPPAGRGGARGAAAPRGTAGPSGWPGGRARARTRTRAAPGPPPPAPSSSLLQSRREVFSSSSSGSPLAGDDDGGTGEGRGPDGAGGRKRGAQELGNSWNRTLPSATSQPKPLSGDEVTHPHPV